MQTRAIIGILTFVTVLAEAPIAWSQISSLTGALNAVTREASRAFQSQPYNGRRARRRKHQIESASRDIVVPLPRANPRRPATATPTPFRSGSQPEPKTRSTNSRGDTLEKPNQPEPDVWTTQDIESVARQCRQILRGMKVNFTSAEPIKKGPCGNAAPKKLSSLEVGNVVNFRPAPIVNCKMIAALRTWLRDGLQPLSKRHLGAPIVRISVMSSYSCRNAYGRTTTRLSEHALANAMDIAGFVTSTGVHARLLSDWGPTKRDLIAREKERQRQEKAASNASTEEASTGASSQSRSLSKKQSASGMKPLVPSAPTRKATYSRRRQSSADQSNDAGPNVVPFRRKRSGRLPVRQVPPPLPSRRPSLRKRLQWSRGTVAPLGRSSTTGENYSKRLNQFLMDRSYLGGPKRKARTAQVPEKDRKIDRAAFLKGAHRAACRIFGTVLGPEANEAHRDHFHVDLAVRRYKNYCR
ncbi:MAG: extensin family protein [Hyphomicrobiaceae bacterium]